MKDLIYRKIIHDLKKRIFNNEFPSMRLRGRTLSNDRI